MGNPEVKGMQDILDKLNAAANAAEPVQSATIAESTNPSLGTGNVSSNAKGMYDILAKLEKATMSAAIKVAEESEYDTPLIAAGAIQSADSINIDGNYRIDIVERKVIDGVKKKFYNIKDENNTLLYEELALFESAMGIVKHMMFNKNEGKIEKIVKLDDRYNGYLTEAAIYKYKSLTLNEGYKVDVAVAKQGNAMHKLQSIKKQIKSLL